MIPQAKKLRLKEEGNLLGSVGRGEAWSVNTFSQPNLEKNVAAKCELSLVPARVLSIASGAHVNSVPRVANT